MPYLASIVNRIDQAIVESSLTDQRFQNRFFAGLVQQIPVKGIDGKTIFIPAILSGIADAVQVVPDDSFNIITYHRIISNTYAAGVANQQFGDGMEVQIATSDVIMIVIGFNNKLLLTAEQTEALFIGGFPNTFEKAFKDDLEFTGLSAQVTSSSFDSVAIFSQEYRGAENYIKPEMSLFQIRYQIKAAFKKGCFTICDDC